MSVRKGVGTTLSHIPGGETMRMFKAVLTSILIFTPTLVASAHAPESKRETNRESRIIPLQAMSEDVEILFGDPETVGEPFVMRIRELPGGVIPPHRHPVDEHITVVQGTIYFGIGDKFDRTALQEIKAGG